METLTTNYIIINSNKLINNFITSNFYLSLNTIINNLLIRYQSFNDYYITEKFYNIIIVLSINIIILNFVLYYIYITFNNKLKKIEYIFSKKLDNKLNIFKNKINITKLANVLDKEN